LLEDSSISNLYDFSHGIYISSCKGRKILGYSNRLRYNNLNRITFKTFTSPLQQGHDVP